MSEEVASISVYNPDKQISEQVTLKAIVKYNVAIRLALTGIPEEWGDRPITHNEKVNFKFQGLQDMISEQMIMVENARAIIKTNCFKSWERKFKEKEDKEKNRFEDEENDYNELRGILFFLNECEQKIITAKKTKKLDDDFIWEKTDHNGDTTLELTDNFFQMREELTQSNEDIGNLLIKHEITTRGAMDDEDITYKEQEELFLERFKEA